MARQGKARVLFGSILRFTKRGLVLNGHQLNQTGMVIMQNETSQVIGHGEKVQDEKKQRFEMSKETSDLINLLEQVEVGQIITYEVMSAAVFCDVRKRCAANLGTARKYLEKEKRILFGTIRNVGLKRATDSEVVMETENGLSKIRRAARRSARKTVCVQDFGSLSEEMKSRHNAALSIFGAIALATSRSKVKQVQDEAKVANDQLAIGKTLELFNR